MTDAEGARTVERLLHQQAALARFGAYSFREENLHDILTEAARECAAGAAVPYCKVVRYRPETNDLLVEAGVGWHADVVGRAIAKADLKTPVGRAFVTGQSIITKDLGNTPDFELSAIYREHGIVATVNVLIPGGDGPYGVLEVDSPRHRDFDEHDINFLTGFANVLAETIATARRIEALRAALAQRDVLARELEHRVRNNLQLVHYLLRKQADETVDAAARRGLEDVARRVMTFARVYDHLLGVGLTGAIDLAAYLRSLCAGLVEVHRPQTPGVELSVNLASVRVDVDLATALGIILNELVANSFEHAFPNGSGTIRVALRDDAPADRAILLIEDDGVGFAELLDATRFGLSLVRRLAEQIHGTVAVHAERGTAWTITIPITRPSE